ncbi:MAG: hypothetical protein QM803_00930 [Rhodocyclaceae bacterium]
MHLPRFDNPALLALTILVLVFALMRLAAYDPPTVIGASIQLADQAPTEQALPWKQDYQGNYVVSVRVKNPEAGMLRLHVFPDDELLSLTVNGQPFSLDGISQKARRDYAQGFWLTIPKAPAQSITSLAFSLANQSGPAGFNLKPHATPVTRIVGAWGVLAALAVVLMQKLPIARAQLGLTLASLIISLAYLTVTPADLRTFDVFEGGGHLDYINMLYNELRFPDPGQGWEYHQPPLYYLLAAGAKWMVGAPGDTLLWGQFFSLALWTTFLVAGMATLRLGLRQHPLALTTASVALAFWPAGIIHSIRIGNDVSLYAFFALSLYFALRWWSSRRFRDLAFASGWMTCAVISKSSGLAVAGTLCILVAADGARQLYRRKENQRHRALPWRNVWIVLGCLAVGLIINFGDNVIFYLQGKSSDWLLSNVGATINSNLRVDNTPGRYVVFDVATFLRMPFMNAWEDQYGRQYFWNFLLRSSLSSEFDFSGRLMAEWAATNGILLLSALLALPIYFLQSSAVSGYRAILIRGLWKRLPWVLCGGLLLALLLAYRIKAPYACNTDFRYIYPALLCLLYFCALPLTRPRHFPIATVLAVAPALIGASTIVWIASLFA